jgi:hypothetical protein
MDDALQSAAAASVSAALEHAGHAAILRRGTAVLAYGNVGVRELSQARQQEMGSRDDVRLAMADLSAAVFPKPEKNDTLELTEGPQLGTWTVLGPDRSDAALHVVRLRRSTPVSATAPGARIDR